MGTRTYSRRASEGSRIPTALGIRSGRFSPALNPDLIKGDLKTVFDQATDRVLPNSGDIIPTILGQNPFYISMAGDTIEDEKNRKLMVINRKLLQEVYRLQKFNGKPTVVSPEELGEMMANGDVLAINDKPVILGRVVSTTRNSEDLMYGDEHHVPRQPGYFGTGTYFAIPRGYSQYDDDIAVLRTDTMDKFMQNMKIMLTTLGITYGGRSYEYKRTSGQTDAEWSAEQDTRKPAVLIGALKKDARTNFDAINSLAEFNAWHQKLANDFAARFGRFTPDLGTMAAMMGYDAIQIPSFVPSSQNELLVFNRSKLIISETYRAPEGQVPWMQLPEYIANSFMNRVAPKLQSS